MKFTPELALTGAWLRPLEADDAEALLAIYRAPEIPGQKPANDIQPIQRMIELSVQMAATQRGMMWALEVGESDNYRILGLVSAYDWQPSLLRIVLRIDGLEELEDAFRISALKAVMDFMAQKYHLRNFAYQWIDGQRVDLQQVLRDAGFVNTARLRQAWRISEDGFADVLQFHCLRGEAKPIPGRLGEQDNPGQNLEHSFTSTDSNSEQRGDA
ncbi:MAG: GNAT family N-acetyltransferase [Oceanobacter sp.]